MSRTLLLSALSVGAIFTASACSNNESSSGPDEHDPARVVLIVNTDIMTNDTLFLPAGQAVTVRGSFFNAADDHLDDVESEHYSMLTFDPTTLATSVEQAAHHFSHDVTVQAAAGTEGMVDIGFGHDALADEVTLHAPVKIIP